jgi:hypothetical protein
MSETRFAPKIVLVKSRTVCSAKISYWLKKEKRLISPPSYFISIIFVKVNLDLDLALPD